MSEALPDFEVLRPATLDEALEALTLTPTPQLMAGGTDLIVNLRHGLLEPEALLDLGRIPEMSGITLTDTGLRIGAGVTLADLLAADATTPYSALRQAALSVAGPSHREVATLGGNLCLDTRCLYLNQSHWWRKSNDFCLKYLGDTCHVAPKGNRCRAAFCGDLAPALMVLGAEAEIAGADGLRRLPLAEMYLEDGAAHLTLGPDEILVAVILPAEPAPSAYGKIRVRGAIDFPLAGIAVACETRGDTRQFRLALTGTNSCPLEIADIPAFTSDGDAEGFFTALEKLVQKAASPQRTTSIAPHYRRLSIAALTSRLARGLV